MQLAVARVRAHVNLLTNVNTVVVEIDHDAMSVMHHKNGRNGMYAKRKFMRTFRSSHETRGLTRGYLMIQCGHILREISEDPA